MSKSQNLRKYLSKEDLLHEEVLRVIARRYPWIRAIHVPNEGKRSDFEQLKFKVLGGSEGVADLFLISERSNNEVKDLWVELKYGKNKLTEGQFKFLCEMQSLGYGAGVVYDKSEDFELLMEHYQKSPKDFKELIVLSKDAQITTWTQEEFLKKHVHKKRPATVKRDLQKSFENKAKKRFGASIKRSALPNAGKLFQSPKKRHS